MGYKTIGGTFALQNIIFHVICFKAFTSMAKVKMILVAWEIKNKPLYNCSQLKTVVK